MSFNKQQTKQKNRCHNRNDKYYYSLFVLLVFLFIFYREQWLIHKKSDDFTKTKVIISLHMFYKKIRVFFLFENAFFRNIFCFIKLIPYKIGWCVHLCFYTRYSSIKRIFVIILDFLLFPRNLFCITFDYLTLTGGEQLSISFLKEIYTQFYVLDERILYIVTKRY